ncbi:MAG: CSLREA domain-containing protein [Acidimicrobiales bacterium]
MTIFRVLAATTLVVALVVGPQLPARAAATFVVTTTTDLPGSSCGATCSLRQAIGAANAAGGSNVIVFDVNGAFALTSGAELRVTGEPAQSLAINGNGRGNTVIDGGGATRVLRVEAGANVTVARATIRNGAIAGDGGGIATSGPLTIDDALFTGNRATLDGGAVINDVGPATLTITNSTFTGNRAGRTAGAIRNRGTATLASISVVDNHQTGMAGRAGGGIASGFNTTLTLTGSTVAGNSANGLGGSGGIANQGTATLDNVRVASNRAVDHGGGIANAGQMTLRNSAVANNVVTGTSAAKDGGGITNYGHLTMTGTRIAGNVAGHDGGGLANEFGATATITGSTISGNRSGNSGGGIANQLTFDSVAPSLTLTNSTVIGNSAASTGGGIFNPDGTVSLNGTAVVSNTPDNCSPPGSVPGCAG